MRILVTGAAGFIGANLVRRFLEAGKVVIGVDNLSRGRIDNIKSVLPNKNFIFKSLDVSDLEKLRALVNELRNGEKIDEVWHLAANSDIPAGIRDVSIDLRDTFMTTVNLVKVMEEAGIDTVAFASSSAVYGDFGGTPLSECTGPLLPLSNYGAMKLASEAILSAWAEKIGRRKVYIFRFPNVVGVPATHGVIFDFVQKLTRCPSRLRVLGDGTQRKEYLHVSDLIKAMEFIRTHEDRYGTTLYNVGVGDEGCSVRFIAEEVVRVMSHEAKIIFGADNKGWVGDVPKFRYSVDKLTALGFTVSRSSSEAIQTAIRQIVDESLG
jgi:UDP-glucose 4-epimerase